MTARRPQRWTAREVAAWQAAMAHLVTAGLYGHWQTPHSVRAARRAHQRAGGEITGAAVDADGFCTRCQERPGWCQCAQPQPGSSGQQSGSRPPPASGSTSRPQSTEKTKRGCPND